MLSCNEGCPRDGSPVSSGQGYGAEDNPRCGGHAERKRASDADDILYAYEHRREHTKDKQSPPARHKIG